MGKSRRVLLTGYPHHLLRKTSSGKRAFLTPADHRFAVEEIRHLSHIHDLHIHAFCVLEDRLHLLVTHHTDGRVISTFMKSLSSRIVLRNRKIHQLASPWSPRFYVSPVEPGQWAIASMAYIERLPVMRGVSQSLSHHAFSSYLIRTGKGKQYWLEDFPEYRRLGETIKDRADVYRHYLRQGLDECEREVIEKALARSRLTGSDRFAEEVYKKHGISALSRGPGRPRKTIN